MGLLAAAGIGLILGACTGGSDADLVVEMYDNRFDQPVYQIEVGDSVEFVNVGQAPHNAIAFDESWSTETSFGDLAMNNGDATTITFDTPGTYEFYCSYHTVNGEGMTATLVVGDADATVPREQIWNADGARV